MNCPDAESLLQAERDGVLAPGQRAALDRHLADCAACRELQAGLKLAGEAVRAEAFAVAVPDADAEWRKVRASLHGAEVPAQPKRRLAPVIWLAAPLAAAAAIALAFFPQSPRQTEPHGAVALASVDFVETGRADTSTMVYQDKESGWVVVWASNAKANG
jgi:anti-sigma factor RsiW